MSMVITDNESTSPQTTYNKVTSFLDTHNATYQLLHHQPVRTSEEAAHARGTNMSQGLKALVFKVKSTNIQSYIMTVCPAHTKIDVARLATVLNLHENQLKLASPEEVKQTMGCEVGGVPPFGNLFGVPIYADESVRNITTVAFNCGTRTDSVIMKGVEYLKLVQPNISLLCTADQK